MVRIKQKILLFRDSQISYTLTRLTSYEQEKNLRRELLINRNQFLGERLETNDEEVLDRQSKHSKEKGKQRISKQRKQDDRENCKSDRNKYREGYTHEMAEIERKTVKVINSE